MVQAGEVVLRGGRVMIRLLKVKVFTTITSKHANSLAREGASAQSGPIPYAGHMSIRYY